MMKSSRKADSSANSSTEKRKRSIPRRQTVERRLERNFSYEGEARRLVIDRRGIITNRRNS